MVARPDTLSTVQLCSVDGRQYQCLPEYQPRVLIVKNTFILMDVMPSDSGNYTVQEKDNTPVSISHVTVTGVYNFTLVSFPLQGRMVLSMDGSCSRGIAT